MSSPTTFTCGRCGQTSSETLATFNPERRPRCPGCGAFLAVEVADD